MSISEPPIVDSDAPPASPPSPPDTPLPLVRIEHLSCRRGSTLALDDVSLEVRRDEMVAVLGPSGCGKTTLLRCLAGLQKPSAGRIELSGQVVNDPAIRVGARQRRIGLVFQDLALWPHWTARKQLEFVLKGARGDIDRPKRVRETLALFHLEGLESRRPSELSGGECQRLALARSVVVAPELWLLDEPLSSLDAHLRQELRVELARIHRTLGLTSLMVTHDQDDAFALADRVAVLRRGRLEQFDRPEALYRAPASRFVAGFVGTWISLKVALEGREVATVLGRFTLASEPGGGVEAGIRPNALRMTRRGESGLTGTVRSVHASGATTRCTIAIGSEELAIERPIDEAPAVGETVGLELVHPLLAFDEDGAPLEWQSSSSTPSA